MFVKRRVALLLSGTFLGAAMLVGPAFAQDAQSQQPQSQSKQSQQQQIDALQKQLQKLQEQMAEGRPVSGGLYNQAPPGSPMYTKAPAWLGGVQISLAGSFIAAEGAIRQHNEVSDGASDPPYGNPGIPLQNSPLWYENEFRFSAQQSRIALKATGDIDPTQHLKGYYEMDFLGASTDANNRESNSFTPRLRQAFFEYDNDNYHFHFSAGQQWTLLTQNRVGMLPQTENVPLTIDAQYVAGFNWLRNPELRFVEDWNKTVWFGFAIDQPAGVTAGGVSSVSGTSLAPSAGNPGFITNVSNDCQGSSHLNSITSCTNDVAPDLIEKIAADPGWGHYELIGLQRWFADDVSPGTGAAGTVAWTQHVTFGWGVGGNALLPVIPKYVDLQGSVLYGDGIGRYGDSQLPDVIVGPTGSLQTIQAIQFLVGAVAHPFIGTDVYAYYGEEQTNANSWISGATHGGWGNPLYTNNMCALEGTSTGTTSGSTNITSLAYNAFNSATTCAFNVQRTQELTVGFWQDVYKGDLGRVRVGGQYEYVRLTAFAGAPGATTATSQPNAGLNPNNNIFFFSFRYYPFN